MKNLKQFIASIRGIPAYAGMTLTFGLFKWVSGWCPRQPQFVTAILILISNHTFSQNTLSGKVFSEETNKPIQHAAIYIHDLQISASTDSSGFFSISKIPDGIFLVEIKSSSHEQKAILFNTKTSEKYIEIFLEHAATEMHEVIVTGVSSSSEKRKSSIPMVVVDQKYLQQISATNIIDALGKIPGVSNFSSGPNVSKPVIRGLGGNRILTLFDGVRQDGQQWGDEHGIEIDQFLVDRIEVIKGPASLMYGSDALAGVVNLLPANPVPAGTFRGSFLTNFQSNNVQFANSISLAGNNKKFNWSFRASHKNAADYKNKFDGRVFGTKYSETDLNARIGVNKKWGYSYVNLSIYNNLQEVPNGSRDSSSRKFTKQISEADTIRPIVTDEEMSNYIIGTIHQHVQHYRVYSASNILFGRNRLSLKFGLQQSIRREYSHPMYSEIAGIYLVLNTFTYDIKYFIPSFLKLETTIGLNGILQKNKNADATEFVIPDYNSFDIGPFIHFKKSLKKIDIAGGVRYDIRSFKNNSLYITENPLTHFDMKSNSGDTQFTDYKHIFSGMSASIGATYNINKNYGVKMNIARGYRSPNIAEISAKGVHPGTGFQQLGDENLKPEFSLQTDAGFFYFSKHVGIKTEIFYTQLSNYIYNQKLKSVNGGDSIFSQAGNDYPVFKFHQTNARIFGGEFSADIHPHPYDWLHFENSVSVLYAENMGGNGAIISTENKYLPYIPPLHTNHELRAEIKKYKNFSELYFKFGVQYFAAQKRVLLENNSETVTASYTLLDAGIGGNYMRKNKTIFSFHFTGNNIANVAYQSNMSRLKYFDNYPNNFTGRSGIYNMGRNISVKIVVWF